MVKDWDAEFRKWLKSKKKKSASDLALEFKIIQEQIRDSRGSARKMLEKERNRIVMQYKKLKKVI